jgi:hypothetical protein
MAKEYTKDELAEWFEQKAMAVKSGGAARNRLFSAGERHADINLEFVGGMYFFRYDPKTKLTLPMYDKYPLAVVIERYNDGFLGMNLHYLTRGQRGRVVTLFNDFYSKKKLFSGTIAGTGKQTNWDLVQNATNGLESFSKQCVKRYLYTHVRSQFIRINPNEYDKAVQLPIDEWVYKR